MTTGYTYSASAHLHALTSTSDGHSYAYDASGNATCRTTSTSTPCSGTPAGAAMTYDNEGRLSAWQNTPSNPTSTAGYLYDAAGQRAALQVATGGTTTTTVYVGALAEYLVSTSTTWRKYYNFAGRLLADNNGAWHYLLTDEQGTPEAQVDSSGVGETSGLRRPYGGVRYGTSEFMRDLGYTGQRKDNTTGITYFGARYYDQDTGVFLSADTVNDGLNRYAYVGGDPETRTDPTGHVRCDSEDTSTCGGGGSYSNNSVNLAAYGAAAASTYVDLRQALYNGRAALAEYRAVMAELNFAAEKAAVRAVTGPGPIDKAVRTRWSRARNAEVEAAEADEAAAEAGASTTEALSRAFLWGGAAIDGIFTGINQWNEDSHISNVGMRVFRTGVAGVVHGAGTLVAAAVGAEVGSDIGFGVGAALGGLAGGARLGAILGPAGAALGIDLGIEVGGAIGAFAGGAVGAFVATSAAAGAIDSFTSNTVFAATSLVTTIGSWFSW